MHLCLILVRLHLTPVRMVIIKKSTNNTFWRVCGKKGNQPPHCWLECKLVLPLWKAVGRILKKLKGLPYDLATLFLGIYTEKIIIQRDRCISMFVATLLTIAKAWTQPKCPLTNEWIKEMWCILFNG